MDTIPYPGKLRISTITAIGDLGTSVDLEKLAVSLASSIKTDSSILTVKYKRGGNKKPKEESEKIMWPETNWNLIYEKSSLNGSKKNNSNIL